MRLGLINHFILWVGIFSGASAYATYVENIVFLDIVEVSEAVDLVEGEVTFIKKSSDPRSFSSYFVRVSVVNSVKGRFKKGDVVEVFLTSHPARVSVRNSVFLGLIKYGGNHLEESDSDRGFKVFFKPDKSFINHNKIISFARLVNKSKTVHSEDCSGSGKFLYEDVFLQSGYKVVKKRHNGNSCRMMSVPKVSLLQYIKNDIEALKK